MDAHGSRRFERSLSLVPSMPVVAQTSPSRLAPERQVPAPIPGRFPEVGRIDSWSRKVPAR
jgi:hypothetical protein